MTNFTHKALMATLRKDLSNTARHLDDAYIKGEKAYKNSMDSKSKEQQINDARFEALETQVKQHSKLLGLACDRIEYLEALLAKHHIKVAKVEARKNKERTLDKDVKKQTMAQLIAGSPALMLVLSKQGKEVIVGKNFDPTPSYRHGKLIYWDSADWTPKDIAFNEFDIARVEDPDFRISQQGPKKWRTLYQFTRKTVGLTWSRLITLYYEERYINNEKN